jgi:hypothetical protein
MTDYASQGKSLKKNIVYLNKCKDHRAVYVALSRRSKAEGMVILQDFDFNKITSGMSGFLKQELRELEILDEITNLRYSNYLPSKVTGIYRAALLQSFRNWKKKLSRPTSLSPGDKMERCKR